MGRGVESISMYLFLYKYIYDTCNWVSGGTLRLSETMVYSR